ncbi:sulfurtransferase TusA family protein [Vibrio sp.]|uniref:sulfurtransferase TusA family protein n=1 Tax=Vibrio sp. TaxID=678 RepID=UPI003D0DAB98
MEPYIVDLRAQRCPMALLLAKRHASEMTVGQSLTMLIQDISSANDIELYLSRHGFEVKRQANAGHLSIAVTKEAD